MAGSFSATFLKCIREKEINHVRAGEARTKFTGIWMVEVDGRIFARSYYLNERSWYSTLLDGEPGDIKCAAMVVPVTGIRPTDLRKITPSVNKAYEAKYNVKPHNKKWVDGLCEASRVEKTIEFVCRDVPF